MLQEHPASIQGRSFDHGRGRPHPASSQVRAQFPDRTEGAARPHSLVEGIEGPALGDPVPYAGCAVLRSRG